MKTAKEVLGKEILSLLKRYKENRENPPWNKEKDIRDIFEATKRRTDYLGIEASAGMFWFNFKTCVIEVTATKYWQPKYKKLKEIKQEKVDEPKPLNIFDII